MHIKTNFIEKLNRSWRNYRYRFVPWIALNVKKKRTVRRIKLEDDVKTSIEEVTNILEQIFTKFNEENPIPALNEKVHRHNSNLLCSQLGFTINKSSSKLINGGTGVVVSRGVIRKGQVAALYPGTVYRPAEPIFFQSIANPFILRCIDNVYIDGNDKNLSKIIYKSCVNRDRMGDLTWLTEWPINPLAIGQYVNNQSEGKQDRVNLELGCNVAYQEFDIFECFPVHLRRFLPNINYSPLLMDDHSHWLAKSTKDLPLVRIVALLALRDIHEGEELFSSYFTIVQ